MIVFLVALHLGTCPGEYTERKITAIGGGEPPPGYTGMYETKCCKEDDECFAGSPCDVAYEIEYGQHYQCCSRNANDIAICTNANQDDCTEATWCDSPSSSAAPTANTVTLNIAAAAAAALLMI